jgi:HEAT repeat protein
MTFFAKTDIMITGSTPTRPTLPTHKFLSPRFGLVEAILVMKSISPIFCRFSLFLLIAGVLSAAISAQPLALQREQAMVDSSSGIPWFSVFFLVAALIGGGAFILWRKKNVRGGNQYSFENRLKDSRPALDDGRVDAEKELEWFRKAKKAASQADERSGKERRTSRRRLSENEADDDAREPADLTGAKLKEKLKRLQYAQLPINSFIQLTEPRPYEPLSISSDPALSSAIEQVNDEYEDDESVRELAVKILAAFKKRNSVESLAQIALYDLSSPLRSKAVTILTDFDHESVFETILLACADPTREVRAAAARGLFRLNFDRAEAWKRLMASPDVFRMRQAARAAIESGIVQKSLDRLVHDDMRIAYEAFNLTALLIKAGETEPIFEALRTHKDERVRMALLHVLKVVKDDASLAELDDQLRDGVFTGELLTRATEAVKGLEAAAIK